MNGDASGSGFAAQCGADRGGVMVTLKHADTHRSAARDRIMKKDNTAQLVAQR
jgi:hypothetical protein